jgi:hypothetical protein
MVFVVYVRLNSPSGDPKAMIGIITHWGLVEADKDDPTLPTDHASRYRKRLW